MPRQMPLRPGRRHTRTESARSQLGQLTPPTQNYSILLNLINLTQLRFKQYARREGQPLDIFAACAL